MADRRVRYVLEVDYDGKSVLTGAADDLRDVDEAATDAGDGLEKAEGGFSNLQASVVTAQSALGLVEQGFGALQSAAQFAYDTLNEGADLSLQQQQFDALATSIGTTADLLQNDLSVATAGLQSNAEMVAGAGQLMSLGLAKSHEEVVALSEVSGQLNWDIQVLGLTIANQSTARLDSLGLSIESVKGKMEAFRAQGMETDEAFKWAIIEAGREKIDVVGSTADTAAGQLQILENVATNVQDAFALGGAEGFADSLDRIAGSAPAAGSAMEAIAGALGMGLGSALGTGLMTYMQINAGMQLLIASGLEMQLQGQQEQEEIAERVRAYQWLIDQYNEVYAGQGYVITQGAALAMGMEDWSGAAADHAEQLEWNARAAEWVAEANERAAVSEYERATSLEELQMRQELAVSAAMQWAAYTEEATARGGDYFTTAMNMAAGQWNVAEAMYASADAQGAGLGVLGDIAVQYGMINEAAREAYEAQAQQQSVIDNLATAAATGKISWEEYGVAVEKALKWLEDGVPEAPAPTRIPVEVEWVDGDPTALVGQGVVHTQLSANYDDVKSAVDEAQGLVDGFASPAEAYEAVMEMDITEVETKAARATELIEGIPETKKFILDIEVWGMELLEELRAMGWGQ